jgi:pectate lyase
VQDSLGVLKIDATPTDIDLTMTGLSHVNLEGVGSKPKLTIKRLRLNFSANSSCTVKNLFLDGTPGLNTGGSYNILEVNNAGTVTIEDNTFENASATGLFIMGASALQVNHNFS